MIRGPAGRRQGSGPATRTSCACTDQSTGRSCSRITTPYRPGATTPWSASAATTRRRWTWRRSAEHGERPRPDTHKSMSNVMHSHHADGDGATTSRCSLHAPGHRRPGQRARPGAHPSRSSSRPATAAPGQAHAVHARRDGERRLVCQDCQARWRRWATTSPVTVSVRQSGASTSPRLLHQPRDAARSRGANEPGCGSCTRATPTATWPAPQARS